MIQSKKDLKFYILEDKKANLRHPLSIGEKLYFALFPSDNIMAFRYMKSLRKYEYAINCKKNKGIIGRLYFIYRKLQNRRLGVRYGIAIAPNTLGYGFYIPHVVGGGYYIKCPIHR